MGLTALRCFYVTGSANKIMMRLLGRNIAAFAFLTCATVTTCASEADINIPDLSAVKFGGPGGISGLTLMYLGIVICAIGAVFGLLQYRQTKALPVHESMGRVSNTIWETCKTYLFQQGKFLVILWLLIAACIFFYFKVLEGQSFGHVLVILLASILGRSEERRVGKEWRWGWAAD